MTDDQPTATKQPVATPAAAQSDPAGPPRPRRSETALVALRRSQQTVFGLLSSLVLAVGVVVAAILIIYVLLVLLKANPGNEIVKFFKRVSKPLAWEFKNLFTPRTVRANITENYGLAAIVYLLAASIVSRLLARLKGGPVRTRD